MCLFLCVYEWVDVTYHLTKKTKKKRSAHVSISMCLRMERFQLSPIVRARGEQEGGSKKKRVYFSVSTNESISIKITQTKHKIMNISFLCVYEWVDFNLRHTNKKKLDACVYISVSTNESISLIISQKKWIDTCVYFYVSTNDWVSVIILASRMAFRNSVLRSVCLCVWSRLDKIYQYVCLSL